MVTKEEVKREFDKFAEKIGKLESLSHELDSIDARGFEKEVSSIRSKLKDVNAITEIEEKIEKLKDKVRIREDSNIKNSLKKSLSSQFERESSYLREETSKIKKKISELENEIKRRKSNKPIKGAGFLKDIPSLERELASLKKKFEEHTKGHKKKIDSGVGVLVDVRFDDFLNQIKYEISERVKEKEFAMESELKKDMESREKFFARRYRDLVTKLQDRYHKQVEIDLKREVKARLEEEVRRRVEKERKAVIGGLIKDNARKMHSEKRELVLKLERYYEKKEKEIEKKYNSAGKEEVRKMKEKLSSEFAAKLQIMKIKMHKEIRAKSEALKRRENSIVSAKIKQREAQIRKEVEKKYSDKAKEEAVKNKAEIEKRKKEIEKRVMSHVKNIFG